MGALPEIIATSDQLELLEASFSCSFSYERPAAVIHQA